MDKEELWRIHVSMTAAQRYYYRNRERKQAENMQRYWENCADVNKKRRERYKASVEAAGSQTGLS